MGILFDSTLEYLKERRHRIVSGKKNSIPFNLPRFEKVVPGIERAKYYLITANTKVGKSQYTDYYFVMQPIIMLWNALQEGLDAGFDIRIHYFSLEMDPREKMIQVIANHIYRTTPDHKRFDSKILKSTAYALPEQALEYIDTHSDFFNFFESRTRFISDIRSVERYKTYIENFFANKGRIVRDAQNNPRFVHNDDKYYDIFIWDHASLVETTKMHKDRYSAIKGISLNNIRLRNFYGGTPVLIQQQSALAENIESQKFRKGEPTIDNLEHNKSTAMDVDYCFSLYSPARNNVTNYFNYDITTLKDSFRVKKILAGRWGGIGDWTPLYFDGAVNHFNELPLPDTAKMRRYYERIRTRT